MKKKKKGLSCIGKICRPCVNQPNSRKDKYKIEDSEQRNDSHANDKQSNTRISSNMTSVKQSLVQNSIGEPAGFERAHKDGTSCAIF